MFKQSMLDLCLLAKMSFGRRIINPGQLYDGVRYENFLNARKRFFNLGYWSKGLDYDEACEQLALKLSEHAQLNSTQTVLSAGCGFGEECALWKEKYDLNKIVGINLSSVQLDVARTQFSSLEQNFIKANVTSMPFSADSFDRVLALESAMHFDTKLNFMKESYRVLKPGGAIAIADIVLHDSPLNFYWKYALKYLERVGHCPEGNIGPLKDYASHLERVGFKDIQIEDISKRVFTGLFSYLKQRNIKKKLNVLPSVKLIAAICAHKGFPFKYILVRATK